jgi:hypothetical protein
MYCPNCSAEASTDQKFCRSCGMELEAVAGLIKDQSPMVKPEHAQDAAFRVKAMLIWGLIITLGAAAAGASLKILGKENIHPLGEFTPYVSVIALIAAIFGMGLMCYPFLAQTWAKPNSRKLALRKPASTIKLLSDEQPGVTEQTTEFLQASEARAEVRVTGPQNE